MGAPLLLATEMARADFTVFLGGGNPAPTAFSLQVTNLYSTATSMGTAPAAGTPAYTVFNGHVIFTGPFMTIVQESGLHGVVAHVLTRLNPNRRYRLQGTAIRGAGYTDRWTVFELAEAQAFVSAHTAGCLTTAQVPALASNEVVINTGANSAAGTGDIFDWQEVQPAPDGTLVIYSRQYLGTVPGGSSAGSYAYSLAFVKVQEFGTNIGPVVIVQQPQSQSVPLLSPATFSVVAHACGSAFSLQWFKDGVPLPRGTNLSYTIPAVTTNDAGWYWVAVSNSISFLTSSNAELVVTSPEPVITQEPVSRLAVEGSNTVFSVGATGTPPLRYQWQLNGTNIAGATNPTLIFASVQPSDTGYYQAIVTNAFGSATSAVVFLQLTTLGETLNCTNLIWSLDPLWPPWFPEPEVSHDGISALQSGPLTREGELSVLSTVVDGPATISFWFKMTVPDPSPACTFELDGQQQWLLRGEVDWQRCIYYLGSNQHTLKWTLYSDFSDHPERVKAWLDEVVYLAGGQPPEIVAGPTNPTVLAGAMATFRVSATGPPPLRYQWQFNGQDIPDATNTACTVHSAQAAQAGAYSVRVFNDYGAVPASLTLTVEDSAPVFRPQRSEIFTILGGEAWLHARALGTEPMSFQWRFNGGDLPAETNEVLKLRGTGANEIGVYQVWASNGLGAAFGPELGLSLTQVRQVLHISVDGLGGRQLALGLQTDPERFPHFQQLLEEGASTLNARCDYFSSVTVPNHISMLTGRPALQPEGQPDTVAHGYLWDDSPAGATIHNSGNTNVPYKASVFDVVHDRGLSTAFLYGKDTLSICATSYDATNGAPDLVGEDNGTGKIDVVLLDASSNLVEVAVTNLSIVAPGHYLFLHFADPDVAGHLNGWGSPEWFDALAAVDTMLGRILSTIETNSEPAVLAQTVVLLTADHGGGAPPRTHITPTEPLNFTVPLLAWGPGFPAGADLYGLFSNRADPGTAHVSYSQARPPLWNGDTGNLALQSLGLPLIPGSFLAPTFQSSAPLLALRLQPEGLHLSWSRSAVGFSLQRSDTIEPAASWAPVLTGLQTNAETFEAVVPLPTGPQFYRLIKN